MISLTVILILLLAHFLADFPFQTKWMAENKSYHMYPLLCHTLTYSTVLTIFVIFLIGCTTDCSDIGWVFFWVWTFITHTLIDLITSRLVSWYYSIKQYRNMFFVIGLDQLLHTVQVLVTYYILFV